MPSLPRALADALEPVLNDLGPLATALRIEPDSWAGPEAQGAMVWFPDGRGTGIYVRADDQAAQQVAMLADQLQDALVESLPWLGLPAVWPECPDHPDSHPLEAVCDDTEEERSEKPFQCPQRSLREQQPTDKRARNGSYGKPTDQSPVDVATVEPDSATIAGDLRQRQDRHCDPQSEQGREHGEEENRTPESGHRREPRQGSSGQRRN